MHRDIHVVRLLFDHPNVPLSKHDSGDYAYFFWVLDLISNRNGTEGKEAVKAIKEILTSHKSILESVVPPCDAQTKPTIQAAAVNSDLTLSSLSIPNDVKEIVVGNIRGIS